MDCVSTIEGRVFAQSGLDFPSFVNTNSIGFPMGAIVSRNQSGKLKEKASERDRDKESEGPVTV